jgi:hypothetical protein
VSAIVVVSAPVESAVSAVDSAAIGALTSVAKDCGGVTSVGVGIRPSVKATPASASVKGTNPSGDPKIFCQR